MKDSSPVNEDESVQFNSMLNRIQTLLFRCQNEAKIKFSNSLPTNDFQWLSFIQNSENILELCMGEICNMLVSLELSHFADTFRVIQVNRNLNFSCLLKGYIMLFKKWEQTQEEPQNNPSKYGELEKGIILRHKAKDDLKTIDPSLFELEQSYKEGLSNFKRVNKSTTNKIFAREISKETKEQEINKQKNVLVNVQLEDDGSELIERLCQDDTEFLKKVEGFLSKSRVLPINKMSTVVNQLDQVLHNLGDTADELDTLKDEAMQYPIDEEEFNRDISLLMALKNNQSYEMIQPKVSQIGEQSVINNAKLAENVEQKVHQNTNKLLNNQDPNIANHMLKEEVVLLMKDAQQKKQVIQELRNNLKGKEVTINDLEYKLKHYTMINGQLKIDLNGAKLAFDEESAIVQKERDNYNKVVNELERLKETHQKETFSFLETILENITLQVENKDLKERPHRPKKQKSDHEKKMLKIKQDSVQNITETSSILQNLDTSKKNEGDKSSKRKDTLARTQSEASVGSLELADDIEQSAQTKGIGNNETNTDKKNKSLSSSSINQFSVWDVEQRTLSKQKSTEKYTPQSSRKSESKSRKSSQNERLPLKLLLKQESKLLKQNTPIETSISPEKQIEANMQNQATESPVQTNVINLTMNGSFENKKTIETSPQDQVEDFKKLKGNPIKSFLFKNETLQSEENEELKVSNLFHPMEKIYSIKRKKSLIPHNREINRVCITERKGSEDFPFLALANFNQETCNLPNIKIFKPDMSEDSIQNTSNKKLEQKNAEREIKKAWIDQNYWSIFAKVESRKIFNGLNSQYKLDLSKSQARLIELSELSGNQINRSSLERNKQLNPLTDRSRSDQRPADKDDVSIPVKELTSLKKVTLNLKRKITGNLDYREESDIKYVYECLLQSKINMQIFVTWLKELMSSKNYKASQGHIISREEVEIQLIESLYSFESFIDFYVKCKNIHQSCGPICVHLAKFRERIKVMISHKLHNNSKNKSEKNRVK